MAILFLVLNMFTSGFVPPEQAPPPRPVGKTAWRDSVESQLKSIQESIRSREPLRHGGVYARYRVLPVVAGSCKSTGIIRCSLGLPGNMT